MRGGVGTLNYRERGGDRPLRVLVADDHPVHQELERAAIESLEFQVTVVADGLEAVQAAGQCAFDLIVLDRNMPVCDGDKAALLIRRGRGASTGALIVCCSSEGPVGEAALLYDAILPEPIVVAAILAMLDSLSVRQAA